MSAPPDLCPDAAPDDAAAGVSASASTSASAPTRSRRGALLPDLRALEAFISVIDAGSMAAAAQRLGLSQSAVSQSVRALEGAHGLSLFDRDVRPARPTRAGQLLLSQARELLAQARAMTEPWRGGASLQGAADRAQIRLGCVDSFAATVGPALIRALSGSARELQLWSGLTPTLVAQLQARELDLAICTEPPAQDARSTTARQPPLQQRRLFSEAFVAVWPRQVDGAPAFQAPQELAEWRAFARGESTAGAAAAPPTVVPLIRYSQRSVIGQQVDRLLRHLGIDAPRRFEFDATDPLLSLVAAGLGWAISTPLCLWQSRAWLGDVQVLPLPRLASSVLARRDFFLLSHAGESSALGDAVARITRQVLLHPAGPDLRRRMPALPEDAIALEPQSEPETDPHAPAVPPERH